VRAIKQGVAVGGRYVGATRMSTDTFDDDPFRVHGNGDLGWRGQYYRDDDRGWRHGLSQGLTAILRMIVPVLALLTAFVGVFMYLDTTLAVFPDADGHYWLTTGHLLIPAAFFVVQLTNRRYGPAYALAQVLLSFAVVAALLILAKPDIESLARPELVPTMREALAFGIAFLVAGFVAIAAFDGARGPMWWTAPLIGFTAAAIFFPLIFFPAAYAGLDMPWLGYGISYMGLSLGIGIGMLIPFFVVRPVVPPLSGFGGY
jgi:uncharacterized PurR-regulated membrane protein YhhQ (DUF165 family)